ncbi:MULTISPECIES: methyl-accepting chemotaxis protein [unclassified Halomonas]|uniref:methyl-accepting chemotaxis protein n=1 Tax=unclassified Halomonas TaxID=2609666 RepID=UPI0021E3D64B|nr:MULTISPECIES: methyl-accepting chemotaxis protein [unclassified Halomonas]UYG00363.1 methyl-accepting chemotaxis protein [Halomonas sp. GD1P12]WNL38562.1 methyl-accepting chemotaxis protein [Halomonas sp. PAMB 3232]WNL41908.1 methyl-accepting chemotaxis protein [Halomonas sp. PAMB 3264]
MKARWKSLPLSLRQFLSFATVMTLTLLLALYLQARTQTQARFEQLIDEELPQQVEALATRLVLRLSPSLAVSESVADSYVLEQWVRDGLPATEQDAVAGYLSRTVDQLQADLLFFAVQSPVGAYYFQYRDGELLQRSLEGPASDDRWYYEFTDSEAPYNLNLDSDTFTPGDSFVFLNFRSDALAPNGRPLVVAGAALNLDQMARLIEDFTLGETGHAALLDDTGEITVNSAEGTSDASTTVSLPTAPGSGTRVEEVLRDGTAYLTATRWVPELGRYLMIEVDKHEYVKAAQLRFLASTGWGLLILLIGLLLLYPLTVRLLRPLTRFQRQLKEITLSLDLTRRVETDDRAELGDLADQTNELLERLARAMTAVSSNALALNSVADRLAQTAGLSGVKHGDMGVEADQTMAAAVEQMASSVAEITSTMEELSTSSTQIADHSGSVVDVANQTLERSRKGARAMELLQSKMQEISSDSEQSLAEIVALGAKSKQISKVMELINTLAAQTKLIAFNAALEASSAGDSGRRFSVVANEIRRLADSVTDSTQEIEVHTEEIQHAISRLVVASEKGAASIEQGVDVSQTTAQDLDAVLKAASQTSNAAQQISLSTQQQKTASSQVVTALRDIDTASARNAQSVRHITDISQEMIRMSAELNELVQEFRLDSSTTELT